MAVQEESLNISLSAVCDQALVSLALAGALAAQSGTERSGAERCGAERGGAEWGGAERGREPLELGGCLVYDDTPLVVSEIGNAAIKGGLPVAAARRLAAELRAARALVLPGALHLLYAVTPPDAPPPPHLPHYYTLYSNLDEEGLAVARAVGFTETCAVRLATGRRSASVPESTLRRFYSALAVHELWQERPAAQVAEKYLLSRGQLQSLLAGTSALAAAAARALAALPALWPYAALLAELAPRLQTAAAPELRDLMLLPGVKKARALQLHRAGFTRVESIARAAPAALAAAAPRLAPAAARLIVAAARMMLIEKVENLRAEAEEVMEELNV